MNRTTGSSRRHDRIAGALLGVHAGDSLGATLEFMPWQAIRARYPEGLRDMQLAQGREHRDLRGR